MAPPLLQATEPPANCRELQAAAPRPITRTHAQFGFFRLATIITLLSLGVDGIPCTVLFWSKRARSSVPTFVWPRCLGVWVLSNGEVYHLLLARPCGLLTLRVLLALSYVSVSESRATRTTAIWATRTTVLLALTCVTHTTCAICTICATRSIALLRYLCYSHLLVLLALPVPFALFALLALPALVLLALLVLLAPLAPVSIVSCFGFTLRQLRLVHLCQVKL